MKLESAFSFLAAALLPAAAHAYPTATNATNTTAASSNLTVALVRAAPAAWPSPLLNKNYTAETSFDLNATVALGVDLIGRAASSGANLVVFPELWFPGYPKGIDSTWLTPNGTNAALAARYIEHSLRVNSTQWNALTDAAAANNIYVALAYSERVDDPTTRIYMAQALLSPAGTTLIRRRKLRPSGIERSFFSDGDEDGFHVIETAEGWGRWGLLECWEHFHPSMTFPMQAQLEDLHVAAFPYMPSPGDAAALSWESAEVNAGAARTYAVNSGAVTLFAAVGYSAVFDGSGVEVAAVGAETPWDERPLLLASVDAGAFRNEAYDVDGEQSWGVLRQIEAEWPTGVPKVRGTYVEKKAVDLESLLAVGV